MSSVSFQHDDETTNHDTDDNNDTTTNNNNNNNQTIDITKFVFDCATHYLNVYEPFISNEEHIDGSSHIHYQQQQSFSDSNLLAVSSSISSPSSLYVVNTFNLPDAMAATQLMDPKMDGCQIPISNCITAPIWTTPLLPTTTTITSSPNDTANELPSPPPVNISTTDHNNGISQIINNTHNTTDSSGNDGMVYPRPIPTGLDDPIVALPWNDITIISTAMICMEILIRFQSLVSGSSVGESTFTCLYAHASVLSDMQSRLLSNSCHTNQQQQEEKFIATTTTTTTTTSSSSSSIAPSLEEALHQVTLNEQHHPVHVTMNPDASGTNSSDCDTTIQTTVTTTMALQWCILACTYSMVDLTEMIREIIYNADIYEEEDFVTHTHNIPFYPSIHALEQQQQKMAINVHHDHDKDEDDDDDEIIDSTYILHTAIRLINDVSTSSSSSDSSYIQLIQDILEYELHLIHILPIMARLHGGGPELQAMIHSIQSTVRAAVGRLNNIHSRVITIIDEQKIYDIPIIQRTIQRSFDSYVIRPLVGNMPLRKLLFQKPSQSIHILRNITTELDTYVCTLLLRGNTLTHIYRMLDNTIACNANVLCRSILLLNLYFDDKIFGVYDLRDLISYDIQQWQKCTSSSSPLLSPLQILDQETQSHNSTDSHYSIVDQQFTEDALVFLNRLAKPIYDTLKLRFLNRNRQRTYLELVVLPEWIALQNEAQIFDLHYNNDQRLRINGRNSNVTSGGGSTLEPTTYFSRYVLMIQIRFMDRYIETGMTVGLFRNIVHDMTFAYWYRDYLLSGLHVQLSNMRQTLYEPITRTITNTNSTEHREIKSSSSSKATSKKKHHHHGKNGKHNHYDRSTVQQQVPTSSEMVATSPLTDGNPRRVLPNEYEDTHELKVIALKRNLCRKTIQYISLLRKVGIISEQLFEFTNLHRIFNKRFDIFHNICQPPPLRYEDYLDGIDASSLSIHDLIQIVSTGYQECRTMIDEMISQIIEQTIDTLYLTMSITELTSLKKVCVGNSVYVQKLRQILEKTTIGNNHMNINETAMTNMKAKVTFDFDSHSQFCIIKIDEGS